MGLDSPWPRKTLGDPYYRSVTGRSASCRFFSVSAPSSFGTHESRPGTLRLEADLYAGAAAGLSDLGYTVVEDPAWDKDFGAVGAILIGDGGRLYAGADKREETWADGR